MEKVLTGIRILDFSSWFAGPYASTLLADMGAEDSVDTWLSTRLRDGEGTNRHKDP